MLLSISSWGIASGLFRGVAILFSELALLLVLLEILLLEICVTISIPKKV